MGPHHDLLDPLHRSIGIAYVAAFRPDLLWLREGVEFAADTTPRSMRAGGHRGHEGSLFHHVANHGPVRRVGVPLGGVPVYRCGGASRGRRIVLGLFRGLMPPQVVVAKTITNRSPAKPILLVGAGKGIGGQAALVTQVEEHLVTDKWVVGHIVIAKPSREFTLVVACIHEDRQCNLTFVGLADGSLAFFLGARQRGQQQGSQDGNDGNDNEKFYESEAAASGCFHDDGLVYIFFSFFIGYV